MKTPTTLAVLLVLLSFSAAPALAQQAGHGSTSALEGISISGLFYLAYQNGEEGGSSYNRFKVNRSYLTVEAQVLPKLSGRITVDSHQDAEGDMKARLKYAYAKYHFGDLGNLTGVGLEGGIVHMVWLDFEEHVDLYRMRDPMFMERSGMFNSADFGLTLSGGFGESLPEEYRRNVSSSYASRYGSFALGVYNGGGYHASEENKSKVVEGRLTFRPLPDVVPGLQVSGLAILGKGNVEAEARELPDWRVYNTFLSYQHAQGTLTAQYTWGEGNQKGSWIDPGDGAPATDFNGYSLFGEQRFGSGWRVIAGYDNLDRKPGAADLGFWRVHGGIGYDLGSQNILLFDLDRREWDDSSLPVDTRFQAVMQLKF